MWSTQSEVHGEHPTYQFLDQMVCSEYSGAHLK